MKINIHNLLDENQRLKIIANNGAVITPPETTVNPTLDVTGNTLSVCLAPVVNYNYYFDMLEDDTQNIFLDNGITYQMEVNGIVHQQLFSTDDFNSYFYQKYDYDGRIRKILSTKYYYEPEYDGYIIRFRNPSRTEPMTIRFIPVSGLPTAHSLALSSNSSINFDNNTGVLTVTLGINPLPEIGRAYIVQDDSNAANPAVTGIDMPFSFTVNGQQFNTTIKDSYNGSPRRLLSALDDQISLMTRNLVLPPQITEFNNPYMYYISAWEDAILGLPHIDGGENFEMNITLIDTGAVNDAVHHLFGKTVEIKTFSKNAGDNWGWS